MLTLKSIKIDYQILNKNKIHLKHLRKFNLKSHPNPFKKKKIQIFKNHPQIKIFKIMINISKNNKIKIL